MTQEMLTTTTTKKGEKCMCKLMYCMYVGFGVEMGEKGWD